jgi:hypothetical protein
MSDMGLLHRPATSDEIATIVKVVLAEAEDRKPEPLAPKLVVPENPDEESAKHALFTVMRPVMLEKALKRIPNYSCGVFTLGEHPVAIICTTFARQDQIRQVLTEYGVCPNRRKYPPRRAKRPGSCTLNLRVPLPEDWREPPLRKP